MSEAELVEKIDRQRVDKLTSKFSEPQWLADYRLQAWESYLQTPMPTERDPEWRRTDLSVLDLTKLTACNLEPARQVDKRPQLPGWYENAIQKFETYAGVLFQTTFNGGYLHLQPGLAERGVIFCDIATAIEKHSELIRPYLSDKLPAEKFSLLNSALFNCGAFLYVPESVEIKEPFLVGLGFSAHGTKGENGAAIFPRLFVVAQDNAGANVVFVTGKEADDAPAFDRVSLAAAMVDVHTKAGARVNFLEVQELGSDVFFVEKLASCVSSDGVFTSLSVSVGGCQVKSDIETYLQAKGASSKVFGVVLGNNNQQFNFNTVQEHNAPDTQSDINFKVAVKDRSSSVYQGIIRVAPVAQRTQAYQSNKNLILGADATADSVPKLEILANDVKCSHGATVGPVDREQLFYLRSRGLTPAQAEELIVLGFFEQVLHDFNMPLATDWLMQVVSRKVFSSASGS